MILPAGSLERPTAGERVNYLLSNPLTAQPSAGTDESSKSLRECAER